MDRQKVNELFADFISEFNLNIKQIEFVKVIIENIIEQGEINLKAWSCKTEDGEKKISDY